MTEKEFETLKDICTKNFAVVNLIDNDQVSITALYFPCLRSSVKVSASNLSILASKLRSFDFVNWYHTSYDTKVLCHDACMAIAADLEKITS